MPRLNDRTYLYRRRLLATAWDFDRSVFLLLTEHERTALQVYYLPYASWWSREIAVQYRAMIEAIAPNMARRTGRAYAKVRSAIRLSGELYGEAALNNGTAIREYVATTLTHLSERDLDNAERAYDFMLEHVESIGALIDFCSTA